MFEPKTLTLPELAERWKKTQRQIIEFAIDLGIPLYFYVDGLVFDANEEWLRHGGDWSERRELESSLESIKGYEGWISRAALGTLGQYEQPRTDEEMQKARLQVDTLRERCDELQERLDARDRARAKHRVTLNARTPPRTLTEIMLKGSSLIPRFAFDPQSPVQAVAGQWIGRMIALEPATDSAVWKPLREEDLFAAMFEVKVVEARNFPQSPHPPTDKTAERPMPNLDAETASERRARRYRMCVDAGLEMPTSPYEHLPKGIGKLAEREGVTRQAFSEDVKAHIDALNGR